MEVFLPASAKASDHDVEATFVLEINDSDSENGDTVELPINTKPNVKVRPMEEQIEYCFTLTEICLTVVTGIPCAVKQDIKSIEIVLKDKENMKTVEAVVIYYLEVRYIVF
ncbi:unnamed protein product [Dibothriocephalus latus]|uniref:Uncharacterized protein n=1 Tax=Dibothriocephalus latus TaxID=60516 RepID=A0A3P7MP71_DIBLA|nr:unnamed protein product [Dibothriocephalus latus]